MIGFNLQARISKLKFSTASQQLIPLNIDSREIWILRDDELGGFWGSKFRKYSSILSHCKAERLTHIICTGGINSNNLAAASVLCAEAGIKVTAFAVDDHVQPDEKLTGNRLILHTAIPPERLVVVPRSEKNSINARMDALAAEMALSGEKSLILQEGGGCIPAVKGSLTLADDVIRPRHEWPDGELPDHIFIDSGTGLTSASLAAGLLLKSPKLRTRIHVVQMAGFEEEFQNAFSQWVTPATSVTWDEVSKFVRVYRPLSPRSYGATSRALFDFIDIMAREFGILTDPVYSAKLFARAFDLIEGQNLKGRILIVHTGGLSGLLGYARNSFIDK